mmetsp:Transcript_46399/g.108033  ORF Transcript_46399/g.108033 Transcript_46399/m.108033 type:complete len:300 (-) Transcript_46399:1713-2612(-)
MSFSKNRMHGRKNTSCSWLARIATQSCRSCATSCALNKYSPTLAAMLASKSKKKGMKSALPAPPCSCVEAEEQNLGKSGNTETRALSLFAASTDTADKHASWLTPCMETAKSQTYCANSKLPSKLSFAVVAMRRKKANTFTCKASSDPSKTACAFGMSFLTGAMATNIWHGSRNPGHMSSKTLASAVAAVFFAAALAAASASTAKGCSMTDVQRIKRHKHLFNISRFSGRSTDIPCFTAALVGSKILQKPCTASSLMSTLMMPAKAPCKFTSTVKLTFGATAVMCCKKPLTCWSSASPA